MDAAVITHCHDTMGAEKNRTAVSDLKIHKKTTPPQFSIVPEGKAGLESKIVPDQRKVWFTALNTKTREEESDTKPSVQFG
ncbi:hypothetical protein [Parendozoicomonas sp. Alg238-R29]|uniref:hypothetical protein n=1 Tax=Parendozoicomonas sp. Alg238-R29 TaxID=2993446 RepID=UPI00248E59FD|nr:hypothetical protein [Parendozoicomonas sp. Alg238-R29]